MLYLLTYDIENDRIRQRIAKRLLANGLERVQYSVYIGELTDLQKKVLLPWVELQLKADNDFSLLLIPLHSDMLSTVEEWASVPLDWEYLKGEKLTLIL